jgi:hypothetical protein
MQACSPFLQLKRLIINLSLIKDYVLSFPLSETNHVTWFSIKIFIFANDELILTQTFIGMRTN